MLTICLSVLWTSADRRRVSNWSTLGKKKFGVLIPVVGNGFYHNILCECGKNNIIHDRSKKHVVGRGNIRSS